MNITSADPTAPPPQPPQPHSSTCDRHPNEQFTGFCPSCLFERLTTLDSSAAAAPSSSSRRPSSAAANAIKSLFSAAASSSRSNNLHPPPPPPPPPPLPKPSKPAPSFLPELRRTKSFSASKNEALGNISAEPHRKSCDVRENKTLWTLFSIEDTGKKNPNSNPNSSNPIDPIESNSVGNNPVLDQVEIEEVFRDPSANIEDFAASDGDGDEIRPVQEAHLQINSLNNISTSATNHHHNNFSEIVEENSPSVYSFTKPMKDHLDLAAAAGNHDKKSSGGGGGGVFWAAASVFSKKWHDWRHKQKKTKKLIHHGKRPPEKPIPRHFRETQSEVADYGHGRRSVDIDPRFSLDAGRISFDDARYSFDEPRASWDGHLIGKSFPRMGAPMVSVLEDAPQSARASRADMQMPLAELNVINGPESLPGGSAQTRDYYLDSSSKRRKSVELERSNSIRKMAAAVVAEIDELKMASNARASHIATTPSVDYFQREAIRDSYPNSLKDDISETFELSSRHRDGMVNSVNGEKKEKKSKKWGWKIWGFMHRKNHKGEDHDEKSSSLNGVERSLSQSWQELRRDNNRNSMVRSNSSVSWRHGNPAGVPLEGGRRSNVETYGNGKKRSGEFVLDKNRNNVRYSPNNLDNGLLRFYLTPHRSNHRKGGTGKVKPTNSNLVGRNAMRMY